MKKMFLKYKEIISYLFFGFLTTVVSWGSYVVFANACGFTVFVSNLLSWICAVTFAFVTNKLWVFESKQWKIKAVAKEIITFVSARLVTGVIEVFGVPILAELGFDLVFYGIAEKLNLKAGIFFTEGIYSKLVFAVVIIILNYIFSKLIVFKKK